MLRLVKSAKQGKAATLALWTAALFGVAPSDAASQETATSGSRALAVVAKDAGKCGAILVGVNEYETLEPLEYASSDARKLRDALVEIGFPSEAIRTFVSDGRIRERPSRDRILKALDETLEASGPDSTVLIALSGHGFETEDGDAAFCPEDVDAREIDGKILVSAETAILIEDVAERLKADDARFKMLIVDACREPASTEKSAAKRARPFSPIPDANGVAFLQSCESQEFSWEHPELKGGVFTAFFAEGLRGAADADDDGGVSFLDVCNYATSQTQRFVREKRDAKQTPFYRFSGVVDFWLKPPTRTSDEPESGTASTATSAKLDEAERLYKIGRARAFGLDGLKIDPTGVETLKRAAELGSVDAQGELAYWHIVANTSREQAGAEEAKRAIEWAFAAAERGNPFAQLALGWCYQSGYVTAQDEERGKKLWAQAFEGIKARTTAGDALATYQLAMCYKDGVGVEIDRAEAEKLYRRAAEAGCVWAMSDLALEFLLQSADEERVAEGRKRLETAFEVGDKDQAVNLARMYYYGMYGAPVDQVQGMKFAILVTEERDCDIHDIKDFHSWYRRFNAPVNAELARFFEKTIESGNNEEAVEAAIAWGRGCFHTGDVENGLKHYRKAVEIGESVREASGKEEVKRRSVRGAVELAERYFYGNGVARDLDEAEKWFRKAAEIDPERKEYVENCLERVKEARTPRQAQRQAQKAWNAERSAGTRKTLTLNNVEYAFRYCPAGEFTMGSPTDEIFRSSDETQRRVTLTNGFWILETEVTQAMYTSIMGFNPSFYWGGHDTDTADWPVDCVTWFECRRFIDELNKKVELPGGYVFRLPTEAEWEYACRAGTTTPFSWGSTLNGDKANCMVAEVKRPTRARSYDPNAWGIYDMHGNVQEWCEDWYGEYDATASTNPRGASRGTRRVGRGGGYIGDADECRAAARGATEPWNPSIGVGFRIVVGRPIGAK